MSIHSNAHIEDGAILGQNVSVAQHAIIGKNVVIGDNCEIGAGAVIDGWTTIGEHCQIHPYAIIGTAPQDLKYAGEKTELVIGSHNTFREFCTVNRGTVHGGRITKIGDHNLVMAYAHIAHDCSVGNYNIFANAATLAGHITVQDHVSIGGLSGVHQFCHIGSYAFIGGASAAVQDILPFSLAAGNHAIIHGINVIGLQRKNFSAERISILKKAFRILFRSNLNTKQAVEKIEQSIEQNDDISYLLKFISESDRGLAKGAKVKI